MWGIRLNNNREWFREHKEEYLRFLYQPTLDLGREVFDRLCLGPGRSLHVCRIYRDARRLHGQGPYKDHLWLTIRPDSDMWTRQPVFWFEITPEGWSYGMGFWSASPQVMATMRREIDENPKQLEKLVRRLETNGVFQLQGQDYARSKGSPSPLLTPWYNKKELSLASQHPFDKLVCSPELVDVLVNGFTFLEPYYQYFRSLCKTGMENMR